MLLVIEPLTTVTSSLGYGGGAAPGATQAYYSSYQQQGQQQAAAAAAYGSNYGELCFYLYE